MTKRTDELVQSICGAGDHPLAPLLRQWCDEARTFSAFVEAHATKIRKKARLAPLEDELADLLAELAVAALLTRDRRFGVSYEPYHAPGQRGPDFQVTYKARSALNVEVTRLRLLGAADDRAATLKLARVMCAKIGQLPGGSMNLLAAVVPAGLESAELAPAALRLLDSYPQRTPGLPAAELVLEDVRNFQRWRQRLSTIALCSFSATWRPQSASLWLNPQARHPLPPELRNYLASPP